MLTNLIDWKLIIIVVVNKRHSIVKQLKAKSVQIGRAK